MRTLTSTTDNSDTSHLDVDRGSKAVAGGSQTLMRGLDVLDAVADGPIGLSELAVRLELTRSTTHRLAGALVERRYLNFVPREGYMLGPKLLELGFRAQEQKDLSRVARHHLEALAAQTGDTVHLGVLDGTRALYLDKVPGSRRINISSRVGERQPLRSTGLGKALLLDDDERRWGELFDLEAAEHVNRPVDRKHWLELMQTYADQGCAYDLEENEDRIRCVAAPVRDVRGRIVGALSVSSAAQYMDDERMKRLNIEVRDTALAISRELGWTEQAGLRR